MNIDEKNYSKYTMREITKYLPIGTKNKIAEITGESYPVVRNVWYGLQYKKEVVDAILAEYHRFIEEIKTLNSK